VSLIGQAGVKPLIDYEDIESHKDPWVGVCLLCWGAGDSEEKRIKWVHWTASGIKQSAHLCKPCWKSLKTILIGHKLEESHD